MNNFQDKDYATMIDMLDYINIKQFRRQDKDTIMQLLTRTKETKWWLGAMEDLLTGYMQATTHVTIKRTGNYFYASIYMDCKHISYSAYSSHSFMNALLSIMLSYKRGSIAE